MHPYFCLVVLPLAAAVSAAPPNYPSSWIDPDTGHRIVQLSREPGTQSLYFTQNAYTKDGKVIVTTPHGLATIDVSTGAMERVEDPAAAPLSSGPNPQSPSDEELRFRNRMHVIETGHRTGAIFYQKGNVLYAMDPGTKVSRPVATLPQVQGTASIATINADETVFAGAVTLGDLPRGPDYRRAARAAPGSANYLGGDNRPDKGAMMERRLAARIPMILFTIDAQTGKYTELLHTTDWLGHMQFSPTDRSLLMFCHEGPWHKVDRIWLINVAEPNPQPMLVHQRTMKMEIAGHEFWGASGEWIWYDLQTPKGEVFWVAGYNVKTHERIWYHLERDQWSVHFNISLDGTLFSGDGGSEDKNVAHAKNGKWIYLFHPHLTSNKGVPAAQTDMVQSGTFDYERLVNLAQHDYVLEPNATFTPDMKWLVFRSNMNGSVQVYAVEIARAPVAAPPARIAPPPPAPPANPSPAG